MWYAIFLLVALFPVHQVAGDEEIASVPDVCHMVLSSDADDKEIRCVCHSSTTDCSDLGLTKLPTLISFPRNILSASFSGNHLQDISDDTFYSGPELVEMDLSHNDIEFFSINTFSPFQKLRSVNLGHNRLSYIPASTFSEQSELRTLDVSFNDIQSLYDATFETLSVLQKLNLRNNPIMEITAHTFQHLPDLEMLYLDATMLNEIPDIAFVHNANLKTLTLSNNRLTEVPSVALKPLKALKHLDLSGNLIETIGSESLLSLDSLRVLYLDQMPQLRSIEAFAFGSLPRLSELHCSFNDMLTHINENAFVHMISGEKVRVEQLFLRDNNIHEISPHLMKWTKNTELDLRGNPWHCDCQSQWLIPLQTRRDFQRHLRCASPSELRGRTLSDLKNQELSCGMSTVDIALISFGSLLGVTLIFVIIGVIMHRRQFAFSLAAKYRKTKGDGIDDFDYDRGMEL